MNPALVPRPDVMALPAPLWLLQFLLLLTFVLHVVPMNLLFGGGILAAVSYARGRNDPRHLRLAERIGELMPVVVAFTVTFGIAPLLFVQVLYGQLLYTSSILMAWAWFMVIPMLILGYYGIYVLRFRGPKLGDARPVLAWVVALLFAAIGFIYSNNFSLMLRPEGWLGHYFGSLGSGRLNWADPTLYPRYLHMLLGALAVAGLWVMLIGGRRRSGDTAWSAWAFAYGAKVFLGVTLVNLAAGLWFLMALPSEVMLRFMGRDPLATGLFVAALLLGVVALWTVWQASNAKDGRRLALLGGGLAVVVVVLMAVIRQLVRAAMLEPVFTIRQLETAPDWGVFLAFAVTLVGGIGVLGWLISVVLRAAPAES